MSTPRKNPNKSFLFILIGLVALALLVWRFFDTIPYGGNFSLKNGNKNWYFADSPRQVNLVYFGFTKCGDVCPFTMSRMASTYQSLSEAEQKKVKVIFVSVDAAHDTPEDAQKFAANFNPQFVGLSGTKAEIDAAVKHFPAGYIIEEGPKFHMGYKITHPDKFFLLDEKGKYLGEINNPKSSEKIADKIKDLLSEK